MPAPEPEPLLIRDARHEDLDAIVAFNAALASETEGKALDPAVLRAGVTAALDEPDRLRYWVAERSGSVVGQVAVTREWSDWRNGWVWWLQSVYIASDHRGLGIFRALFAHVRESARAEPDVIGLRLYVEHANDPAQRTYQALGMRPGGYHVYEDLWVERFNRPVG